MIWLSNIFGMTYNLERREEDEFCFPKEHSTHCPIMLVRLQRFDQDLWVCFQDNTLHPHISCCVANDVAQQTLHVVFGCYWWLRPFFLKKRLIFAEVDMLLIKFLVLEKQVVVRNGHQVKMPLLNWPNAANPDFDWNYERASWSIYELEDLTVQSLWWKLDDFECSLLGFWLYINK